VLLVSLTTSTCIEGHVPWANQLVLSSPLQNSAKQYLARCEQIFLINGTKEFVWLWKWVFCKICDVCIFR